MIKNLNVCLFPMSLKWGDKIQNLKNLEDACAEIHPDTDLLVLPETFSTGFPTGITKDEVRQLAERNTESTIDFIKYLAHKFNMAIAGTFIANSGGNLYNRAFIIEPSGEESFADKRHLFTMAGEDKIFSRGHDRLKVRFRGWEVAMIVCYDIRFPIWSRNIRNDYDLLIVSANWPKVRVDAWNKLLYARAIENEAYVIGVNCKGIDNNGFEYDGASMAIDFKGKDISSVTDPESPFIYATLSKEKLDRFREKFPAFKDADSFIIK
ncbi:MAG: nitrilase family protein [Muribaculaceae bacterium]|nr:nitrilase family protein [Muribaculaceae bacterium]